MIERRLGRIRRAQPRRRERRAAARRRRPGRCRGRGSGHPDRARVANRRLTERAPMYMLQLFDTANDLQPIDARLIREGLMRIGRDSAADRSIAAPDSELSRAHCELEVAAGGLTLRALGANGEYADATGDRFPDAIDVAVPIPSTLRFGRFRLRGSLAPHGDEPVDAARTLVLTPPLGDSA